MIVKKNDINIRVREKIEKEHFLDENGNPVRFSRNKQMDGGLIIVVFLMICFGMVMLFSASMTEGFASEGDPMFFIQKQGLFTIAGILAAIFIAAFIPIRKFDNIVVVIILFLLATLLIALIFIPKNNDIIYGVKLNGARRWVSIFGFQFQPTELAKIALVFCFAGYTSWVKRRRAAGGLAARKRYLQGWYDGFLDLVIPVAAIAVWMVMILFQPHVSCLVIMALLSLFLFLTAKIPLRSWVTGIVMLILIGGILILVLMVLLPLLPDNMKNYVDFKYVIERLDIFSGSSEASEAAKYQTTQSLNAIGSGGIFGVGIGNSIQKWGYLPMQYNDYIFSIIAEELGLIGACSVMLLFIIYMIMGVRVSSKAATIHGCLIAFGYTMLITIQAFLNIGVATKAIPPTGITLPFFSYGGTSTMFFFIAIGLLLCVSKSGIRMKRDRALS
jgi:cell division protein FtsW